MTNSSIGTCRSSTSSPAASGTGGESPADLVQVATIGLIKAIDRFDPTRGLEFATFGTPTIIGELKRHFRDRASAIRVPRRLQEQQAAIARASTELFQQLGRSPTVAELSAATGLTEEQALDCLECSHAYSTVSLDAVTTSPSPDSAAMLEALRTTDEALEEVERREALRPLLDQLPERERRIVILRFFRGMTQSEIAAEIGISQMHVSRLLTSTLSRLRAGLAD
ncbi:SigB/SigF/SigG family RNA polymerase sigma factor [Fodinicola feengrottensis]|uniref:SigB/SigF/SigG family RNA polymerase sigma factor n=1 Tax=Fodinicola feengrottensis TaxID=435914 RepID=UPI0024417147|nr:SigB/SigF/SigG family RNA polymerase sigma factor [Fodinicola feengrottensis]